MKYIKIIYKIVFCLVIIIFISTNVNASNTFQTNNVNIIETNQFNELGNIIMNIIQVLGILVSVGALMIMGIKYMTSTTQEKSMEKENMIYYVVGAILLFAIVNIVSMIYKVVNS